MLHDAADILREAEGGMRLRPGLNWPSVIYHDARFQVGGWSEDAESQVRNGRMESEFI